MATDRHGDLPMATLWERVFRKIAIAGITRYLSSENWRRKGRSSLRQISKIVRLRHPQLTTAEICR
jgi:hypothetical protein